MSTKPKLAATTRQNKAVDQWTEALEAININEQQWCCMVIMIVETLPEYTAYTELFDDAAEKGSRRAIYPLTFKKLISSVKTLSKVDRDKCPVIQGVMHHANDLISRNDILGGWLMARVVKYILLRAKTEALARRTRESNDENEGDQELQAMLTVGKMESRPSMKSTKSKKSAQPVEIKPQEKANTRLRKFGEEWKEKVYVDDAPKGGPDLYVILSGFRDPALPLELIKAGVPLTCILKIKRPGDETRDVIDESHNNVDNNRNEYSNFTINGSSNSGVTTKMLQDFWFTLDKSSNDPKNFDDFSSVIFRTFCPPDIPTNNDHEDAEIFKRDLYNRISCIVYDLYDLQCLHVDYIKSMKVENVPADIHKDRDFSVYRSIMDAVPAECSFVAIILQAMLAQVEYDLQDDAPFLMSSTQAGSDKPAKSKTNVRYDGGKRSVNPESFLPPLRPENPTDGMTHHQAMIRKLNSQYGIHSKEEESKIQQGMLDIIVEDDRLRSKTYHIRLNDDAFKLVNPKPESLADLAMRSLRDPRVIDLWKSREHLSEESKKKNRYHLNKLIGCFAGSVDFPSLVHYLHLQAFHEMIHGNLNRTAAPCEDPEYDSVSRKGCYPSAKRSDPFPLSTKTVPDDPTFASEENPISNLRGFESDSIIDYGKNICDIFECPELFALTDTHEMLRPESLGTRKEKVCETQAAGPSVAEFTDVRILSENVFLQMVHECLRRFKGFQSRYVETTDSVLLYFGGQEGSSESDGPPNDRVMRIVTPVCLRNFSEYVVAEEGEWIRRMEMDRARAWPVDAGELSRKLSHHSDIDTVKDGTFTDDDFVLPNSLKGQARTPHQEKSSDEIGQFKKMSKKSDKPDGKIEPVTEDGRVKAKKIASRSSMKKTSKDIKSVDIESSSLPASQVSTLRCALHEYPYRIAGYNLGNRRVQLTTRSETFASADGTLVEVVCDEWLYGKKMLGISIHLSGCLLKLERPIDDPDNDNLPFHLITESGIVMAFAKTNNLQERSASGLSQNHGPQFDFRASWPSSLLVELARDDSSENSFHILQRYISKGPECEPVSRENYRKFLRNGTVLKFLDDDAVEVMRPNGTIVRCLEFEKVRNPRDSDLERDGELTRVSDEIPRPNKSRSLMSTRRQQKASSPTKQLRRTSANVQNKNSSTAAGTPLDGGIHSPQEDAARAKITRYTALEHDGRCYEVVNEEVSRVFDRSLVRTSTDFEVSEKLTRREDGTQSILNSKGELVVSFPDGTRITTGFVVEAEPLINDWSDEEFSKFFENVSHRRARPSEGIHPSHLSHVTRSGSYRSSGRRSASGTDRLGKLLDDAFVSILMTCRMEHECYTTVDYDQAGQCCKLSMPDGVVIGISREGLYDISVGRNIELRIGDDDLTFSSKFHENDRQTVSTTIYHLRQSQSRDRYKSELLVTVDSVGEVFKVLDNGTVVRDKNNRLIGKTQSNRNRDWGRLFAMNRDSTAYEYLHKSKRDEYKKKMNSDGRSSVISVAIPNRAPGVEYRVFLNPLEPENYSKMWLQTIGELKRTNHDRTDLLRSTYSIPYNWLFPFGKNGNGIRKNTWKVPLVESIQEGQPRVLTLKVFEGIAETGENVLTELHRAMARYWPLAINERRAYCTSSIENSNQCFENQSKNWVDDLALGIKSNIDLETYLGGVTVDKPDIMPRKIHGASGPVKLGQRELIETEEIRWYKKCLREHIILPYFETIQGSCFLWIMACINEALELVKK